MLSPFTILIDSREQLPYSFESVRADAKHDHAKVIVPVRGATLHQGDYAIEGLVDVAAVERKSLADLFNTLGQGRARFVRELERLSMLEVAAVVMEAEWSTILADPPPYSQLVPKTVFRSVMAWMIRFPTVHWIAMPGRRLAEQATYRFLERVWLERQRAVPPAATAPPAPIATLASAPQPSPRESGHAADHP